MENHSGFEKYYYVTFVDHLPTAFKSVSYNFVMLYGHNIVHNLYGINNLKVLDSNR